LYGEVRIVIPYMRLIPPSIALLLVAFAGAGCASSAGAPRAAVDPRTRIPPGVRPEWLHFRDPRVAPGEPAPGFSLPTPDGATTVSLDLFRGRPLVLIFGSWT
jgi:hypothetical protein